MKLNHPFEITSRLMAGIHIANATISLECGPRNHEGRTQYHGWIDLPDGSEYELHDLQSGCQGGSIQEGMESLLSFLGAAAEAYPDGENADMFPAHVTEWTYQNEDEISMLLCEIEESPNLITA